MASTYVNDLRLNEMATGDQSGSWGTVTNTNLELIAEAFSYSAEAITTNADAHTTTIADGATDPGRSMFLKYTGTLDSACTITIGPNTVSKLWFIENATSGSQNIIIKQGSGATVTIASGKTKAIYSDGVGSGAKMVDAFAALDVGALSGTSATFDGGVDIDNINIDGTTIALSSGNLTVDVAGKIDLSADDEGNVRLFDGSAHYGTFLEGSNNFIIQSVISDGDVIIKGNDGGSAITALTLDMSNGGRANFNNDIGLNNNRGLKLGSGDDSVIYNDGSNTYIRNNTSNQDIIFQGNDDGSANTTALTLDMSAAGAATFNGAITSGGNITVGGTNNLIVNDSGAAIFGNDGDLSIGNSGTIGLISAPNGDMTLDTAGNINLDADGGNIRIKDGGTEYGTINKNGTANLSIYSSASDADMLFQGNDGGSVITALTLDMSAAGAATFNGDVNAPNFNTTSDATLKTNVETLTGSLDAVKSLRGVSFDWLENGGSEIGVIAQEVEDVLPDVVNTNEDGIKSVKYGNMVGLLIEAIKEQQAQIDELKVQINS